MNRYRKLNVKAIIGAGYGDEGKGLMTDYFCNELATTKEDALGRPIHNVLNIKYNGGAQAGHTVARIKALDKDTKQSTRYFHWVFAQFGSGTFAGADTYLDKHFIVNIGLLVKEYEMLSKIFKEKPNIFINTQCAVTLPIDIILNRLLEDARKTLKGEHGSCGYGIYENWHRNSFKKYNITLGYVLELFNNKPYQNVVEELIKFQYTYALRRIKEIERVDNVKIAMSNEVKEQLQCETEEFLQSLKTAIDIYTIEFVENTKFIRRMMYDTLVFEGAQGLELSMNTTENAPHLTPSDTGVSNIIETLKDIAEDDNEVGYDVEVCFVTRSYKTKHGAGPFKEESDIFSKELDMTLYDTTNNPNKYQGELRYGVLDLNRLKELIQREVKKLKSSTIFAKISMAVTHLDQTYGKIVTEKDLIDFDRFDNWTMQINGDMYYSFGEKATDIIKL